jgi:hypothetical protein
MFCVLLLLFEINFHSREQEQIYAPVWLFYRYLESIWSSSTNTSHQEKQTSPVLKPLRLTITIKVDRRHSTFAN